MKRILVFAAICLVAVSCSDDFKLKGTIHSQTALDNGALVTITNDNARTVDTLQIKDGKFTFKMPANDTSICYLNIVDPARKIRYEGTGYFVPEKGTATADYYDETGWGVQGGTITAGIAKMREDLQHMYEEYGPQIDSLKAHQDMMDKDAYFKEFKSLTDNMTKRMVDFNISLFKENKDNILGLRALISALPGLSLEQIEELVKDASPYITENPKVKLVYESQKKIAMTSEGAMFTDFEGKSPEGEIARLSDFVGRGKYVLVDFWASWCAPCKELIPEIKKYYDKYSKKGFVVVGVPVNDGDNSGSREIIKQFGMNWPQIFMGNDKTCVDIYGIMTIPHLILFAPDGTILKRTRGANSSEIFEIISSVYEK